MHGKAGMYDTHGCVQGGANLELNRKLSAARERAVALASGNRVMGIVQRVGVDQLVLSLDGEADSVSVPIHKIDQVVMAS